MVAINMWNLAFYNHNCERNFIFNNIHEKNKITIRCLLKIDMALKEKGSIHQTNLCGTHHVRYCDPIVS